MEVMRIMRPLGNKFTYRSMYFNILKYTPVIVWTLIVILPLLVVLFTSFKTDAEYTRTSVFQMPASFFNFENYKITFTQGKFLHAFKNSLILVAFGSIGSVVLGTMTAYCLSRFDFLFKNVIKSIYIVSVMIPGVLLQVSIYPILKQFGFTGHLTAPILIYLGSDIIQIWIYLQFIDKISTSLDESAMLDGASYLRIFRSIIFPMLAPATATVIILKSISIYNDMFTQYLYNSSPKLYTVINALMTFAGDRVNQENLMSAGIMMIMIPTILMFLFMQKYILSGITLGSSKE
jgi:raffinose/stachyose/melibiose transport system permease protein